MAMRFQTDARVFIRLSIMLYRTDNTISVSKVDEIMPPMTTVASGFCTSAPIRVESIIGKKPKMSTSAVMRTGLNRTNDPVRTISWVLIPRLFS